MPTPDEISASANAKIRRAEALIVDLDREINEFFARGAIQFVCRTVSASYKREWYYKHNEAIPEQIVAIFGDALHNLSSALDHVLYKALSETGANQSRIQFPMGRTDDLTKFQQTMQGCQLTWGSQELQDAVTSLRPFVGGNQDLVDLHFLDLMDKHRVLLASQYSAVMGLEDWYKVSPAFRMFQGGGQLGFTDSVITENLDPRSVLRDAEYPTAVQPKYNIFVKQDSYDGVKLKLGNGLLPATKVCGQLRDAVADAVNKVALAAA